MQRSMIDQRIKDLQDYIIYYEEIDNSVNKLIELLIVKIVIKELKKLQERIQNLEIGFIEGDLIEVNDGLDIFLLTKEKIAGSNITKKTIIFDDRIDHSQCGDCKHSLRNLFEKGRKKLKLKLSPKAEKELNELKKIMDGKNNG